MSKTIIQATPRDYYVYAHKRATTGEIFYIGKGTRRRAWAKSCRSPYWSRIVKKHGYTIEIVQDGLQEFAAFELECDLIALYGRKDCKLGPLVNVTDGGDGPSGTIVGAVSREKLRHSTAKLWTTSEYREKTLSAHAIAIKSDAYKKILSKKVRARLITPLQKATQIASCAKSIEASKKKVLCVETGQLFQSVAEALIFLRENGYPKASQGTLSLCCIGSRKSAYGSRWIFTESGKSAEAILKAEPTYVQYNKKKKVLCVETGRVFDSGAEVEKFLRANGFPKASHTCITQCCRGGRATSHGFQWRYAD